MNTKKRFIEFAVWLSVVVLLLLVIYQAIYIFWPQTPVANFIVYIFLVPYALNLIIYFLLLKGMTLDPQHFVQIIILSIVLRLILFGAFNFGMIYFSPDTAMPNVVAFFVIYLASVVVELTMLVPLINKNHKENSKPKEAGEIKQ